MKFPAITTSLVALCSLQAAPAMAVDEADATTLLEASRCIRCHDVQNEITGPSFRKTAAKYKGNPEAPAKLTKHITVPNEVKIDGEMEKHGQVKTRDADRIGNLVNWILSQSGPALAESAHKEDPGSKPKE